MNYMNFTPTRPDEYFTPGPDDGSWFYQSQLEQQEQDEISNTGDDSQG